MQTIGTVLLASAPQFGGSCGDHLEPSPSLATAYSYERVSSGLQAEKGRGLDRQANAAERWCATNGHTLNVDLRLSDAGLSAFKGDHLSKGALGRFLDMAQAGDLGAKPTCFCQAGVMGHGSNVTALSVPRSHHNLTSPTQSKWFDNQDLALKPPSLPDSPRHLRDIRP